MNFDGKLATIEFGDLGIHSDDPPGRVPFNSLKKAYNVTLREGLIAKEPGSQRYNSNALPAGVGAVHDWWPDDITQRLMAACKDGQIYRYVDVSTAPTQVTAASGAPSSLQINNQTHFLAAGKEVSSNPRKLFIFTGSDRVQVIDGDGTTRRNLTTPAADWSGTNHPRFGFAHRARILCFGNKNDPHRVYISSATNHEEYVGGTSASISVEPGEGEFILSGFVYGGKAFVVKYPFGLYQLVDTDPSASNWFFVRLNKSLGVASEHSVSEAFDDVLIANSNGSISSIKAVETFKDVESGDVLNLLRCESFVRNETSQVGLFGRHMIYYPDRKQIIVAYRNNLSLNNNRALIIDFTKKEMPKVTWSTKDQINCLALRKDITLIERPMYGSEDGYVYIMDSSTFSVHQTAYTGEFETQDIDLSHLDRAMGAQQKNWYHLEVTYESMGQWDIFCDVIVDGRFLKTIPFSMKGRDVLDEMELDDGLLDPEVPLSKIMPLGGFISRKVAFRFYNSGLYQGFRITGIGLYYKLAGQIQTKV